VDTLHDAGAEDPSVAIQHRLQAQKSGNPRFNLQDKQKRRTESPQKHHPKELLNSPALGCLEIVVDMLFSVFLGVALPVFFSLS
jgi:hypothetical protein